MIDKLIAKVGEKTFAAIAAALSAAIVALVAAIERYFATRRAYDNGRNDERKIWKEQEKIWMEKIEEVKKSNLSLWDKFKKIKSITRDFEKYKKQHQESEDKSQAIPQ